MKKETAIDEDLAHVHSCSDKPVGQRKIWLTGDHCGRGNNNAARNTKKKKRKKRSYTPDDPSTSAINKSPKAEFLSVIRQVWATRPLDKVVGRRLGRERRVATATAARGAAEATRGTGAAPAHNANGHAHAPQHDNQANDNHRGSRHGWSVEGSSKGRNKTR